jgi:hypothetical protein
MKLEFSFDERLLERAELAAQASGTTLTKLVERFIQELAVAPNPEVLAQLVRQWANSTGDSRGEGFTRADAYDGRC